LFWEWADQGNEGLGALKADESKVRPDSSEGVFVEEAWWEKREPKSFWGGQSEIDWNLFGGGGRI